MRKINREDLFSLEKYEEIRPSFRERVMEHKASRRVPVGPSATLYFEDRLTIHYQIQEMLRAERIFDQAGIEGELSAYNPLIPDGANWKATFMIEYDDPAQRRAELARLVGIERRVWVMVEGFNKVFAIADEDLERSTPEKTAAVHFLRFELSGEMVDAIKQGASVTCGIDHPLYRYEAQAPEHSCKSLALDLD
ncbi:MAG: DUF3501 family protein [Nitrospinae bacterium]|nr:DUF3501 family protein [Nitrospinota bacterium]